MFTTNEKAPMAGMKVVKLRNVVAVLLTSPVVNTFPKCSDLLRNIKVDLVLKTVFFLMITLREKEETSCNQREKS